MPSRCTCCHNIRAYGVPALRYRFDRFYRPTTKSTAILSPTSTCGRTPRSSFYSPLSSTPLHAWVRSEPSLRRKRRMSTCGCHAGLRFSVLWQVGRLRPPIFPGFRITRWKPGSLDLLCPPLPDSLEWKRSWTIVEAVKRIGKPNFAGRYVIAQWLYGLGVDMAVTDARTAALYPSPLGTPESRFLLPNAPSFNGPEFRLDSRLLIIPEACIDGESWCQKCYFLWRDDTTFRLLRKIPTRHNPIPAKSPFIGTWQGTARKPDQTEPVRRFRLFIWERKGRLRGAYLEGGVRSAAENITLTSWRKSSFRMEIQGNCWIGETKGDTLSARQCDGKCGFVGAHWICVPRSEPAEVRARRVRSIR
jgi:hypothetical protein